MGFSSILTGQYGCQSAPYRSNQSGVLPVGLCLCPYRGEEGGIGREDLGWAVPNQIPLILLSGCSSPHVHEAVIDGVLLGEMTFLEVVPAPQRANAQGYGHYQLKYYS